MLMKSIPILLKTTLRLLTLPSAMQKVHQLAIGLHGLTLVLAQVAQIHQRFITVLTRQQVPAWLATTGTSQNWLKSLFCSLAQPTLDQQWVQTLQVLSTMQLNQLQVLVTKPTLLLHSVFTNRVCTASQVKFLLKRSFLTTRSTIQTGQQQHLTLQLL